jgi:hypothetical protein
MSISSHAVDYVPAPAWKWDSPLTRTPHFCHGLSLTFTRVNAGFFFPIQQCRSSFPERSHHLGHGLSRVLSLMHPHTCHQALLDRVTACVSHTKNTTKFCGCGKSRMHYLGHCCQPIILHCTAWCAVLCCVVLCCVNLNWFWSAYCLGVQWLLAHSV